jgi:tetratricopeptide (TPR) repeat protein
MKIELGGTGNSAAFGAYLRGTKAFTSYAEAKDLQTALAEYTEAIRLDQNYALAFAGRSRAHSQYANEFAYDAMTRRENFDKAQADARQALALAPELADGHLALASFLDSGPLDFTQAREAYERALALAPGNAEVLRQSGSFLVFMGQFEQGISAARRAVALDPLNRRTHNTLGYGLQPRSALGPGGNRCRIVRLSVTSAGAPAKVSGKTTANSSPRHRAPGLLSKTKPGGGISYRASQAPASRDRGPTARQPHLDPLSEWQEPSRKNRSSLHGPSTEAR